MTREVGSASGASAGAPRRPEVLDLFSGIGGFALAFEAAGFETIAFSEIEPYPCKVLAQHWPEVPNLGDVRGIDGRDFAGVDVVCGGFPCQDISSAGKGAGIQGERSGLWFEMLRIIRGARPAFCLIENVPALRTRGADVVLGGLEESGYAARPFVVGAGNAGAPHLRARAWVVAYLREWGRQEFGEPGGGEEVPSWSIPDPVCAAIGELDADAYGSGLFPSAHTGIHRGEARPGSWDGKPERPNWWASEPAVVRMVHGVPNRAHRIKALGNSIVPAVAYPFAAWIYGVLMAAQRPAEASEAEQSPEPLP